MDGIVCCFTFFFFAQYKLLFTILSQFYSFDLIVCCCCCCYTQTTIANTLYYRIIGKLNFRSLGFIHSHYYYYYYFSSFILAIKYTKHLILCIIFFEHCFWNWKLLDKNPSINISLSPNKQTPSTIIDKLWIYWYCCY